MSHTWIAPAGPNDRKWSIAANWDDAAFPPAGDGGEFSGSEENYPAGSGNLDSLPNDSLLAAGVVDFEFTADYDFVTGSDTIIGLMSVGVAINDLTINHVDAVIVPGGDFNAATISLGLLHIAANRISSALVLVTDNLFLASGVTLTADGAIDVDGGTIDCAGGGETIDGLIATTGGGGGVIDWQSSLTVTGGIDWEGLSLTHQNADGTANITYDTDATNLDLGAATPGLDVTVDGGGGVITVTATRVLSCATFTLADANTTYDDGGFDHTVAGNISMATGSLTSTGEWTMSASGTFTNPDISNALTSLVVSLGATLTVGAVRSYVKSVTLTGTIDATGGDLNITVGSASWWSGSGAITGVLKVRSTTNSPGGDIVSTDLDLEFETTGTTSMTLDAEIDLGAGDLLINGSGAGDLMTVDLAGMTIQANKITLGAVAANTGSGVLECGEGQLIIGAGGVADGNAANDSNALNLDVCKIELAGTLDGTNITVTNTAAHIIGGTVSNVDLGASNELLVINGTDGGGNTNVRFVFSSGAAGTAGASSIGLPPE